MNQLAKKIFKNALGIAIIFLGVSSCIPQTPIRVGFSAGLTGSNAALGVDGRDGAQLAVDQINEQGGINHRRLELLVRDDFGTKEGAIEADRNLIENERVQIIIGHMTSSAMISAWDEFKNSGVIFISPTVSTPQLQGMDDNFFRLIPVNSFVAERLAMLAAKEYHLKRIAIFYDSDNAAFTDTYREGFSNAFIANGGEIILAHEFSSKSAPDFKSVLHSLKKDKPDGLFLIASAFDTALIAQQAKIEGLNARLLATNWVLTDDLIENGGAAVDEILCVVSHNENNQSPEYADFSKKFTERYGREPTFASGYGYESVLALASALSKTNGESQGLKDALLATKDLRGLNGNISFDAYGDVSRTLYLITVQNGHFTTLKDFPAP